MVNYLTNLGTTLMTFVMEKNNGKVNNLVIDG